MGSICGKYQSNFLDSSKKKKNILQCMLIPALIKRNKTLLKRFLILIGFSFSQYF